MVEYTHADWARDYRILYLYAMRQARMHKRCRTHGPGWKREACYHLAKEHQHITAQDTSKKERG